MTETPNDTQKSTQNPLNSTLIEFPGVNRNRPAWRKELSEKVREIQQRRAREAESEADAGPLSTQIRTAGYAAAGDAAGQSAEAAKQLGLVPPPEAPEMNPLVVAALRRIERARARTPQSQRPTHGRAQAATARLIEEQYEPEVEATTAEPPRKPAPVANAAREESARAEKTEASHAASNLVVVATAPKPQAQNLKPTETPAGAREVGEKAMEAARPEQVATRTTLPKTAEPATKTSTAVVSSGATTAEGSSGTTTTTNTAAKAEAKPQPRKIAGVIDEHWLERRGVDLLPKVEQAAVPAYDDRAPFSKRIAAAVCDLLAVAFLCAPFAAIIELTIGEWRDPRVFGSMGGILAVVMFLYHTCAVALAGRTWGMRLFSLHAVDADTASVPTTWQCARRALVYMISLATFGLGILYAILDAEGRTAHDLLSRTAVVRE
jgi:uncharacterized RDD family membrane protein YckC